MLATATTNRTIMGDSNKKHDHKECVILTVVATANHSLNKESKVGENIEMIDVNANPQSIASVETETSPMTRRWKRTSR